MKKLFLLFVLAGAMPLSMMAQDDDLYFTPKKKSEVGMTSSYTVERPTYYAGTSRSVDEYNRRGKFRSSYQKIGTDSLGNDIIEFQPGTGVYPDSAHVDTLWVSQEGDLPYEDDFAYSRRMSRWDGYYGWYDPWYFDRWGWHPFGYYSWYDPWYGPYGWHARWYDPWYYGYYGWGYPYGWYRHWGWGYPYYGGVYYGGVSYARSGGVAGTRNHGRASYGGPSGSSNGRTHSYASGTFGGRANTAGSRTTTRNSGTRAVTRSRSGGTYRNSHGNFGGSSSSYGGSSPSYSGSSSSSGSYSAPARSSSSSYGGGSSYGGSRSGGSSGGGGSRGGGGGFGGRR
ncbi:MAG: hypothetical protein IJ605_04645 [Prevotella sp.]|nr:hypothetical protein [Prevotella sp.]